MSRGGIQIPPRLLTMTIAEKLADKSILVSDGAWGTALQERGLKPGECPELWCLEHRDAVLEIARSYVRAGADIIETNSFGGNRFKLEYFGLKARVEEINRTAAEISREAAGPDGTVIGSMGPTGKLLIMGDVPEDEIRKAFADQAVALEKGGADACCIETFSAIDEATLAIRAVRENTDLEIVCTFTFERTRQNEYRSMMGVAPSDIVDPLLDAGADIIGTNCGNGMRRMADIVRELRSVNPTVPILVHANAGAPRNENGVTVFPETPSETAENAVFVLDAGAQIIGGCCGTTPEHIRALREVVDARR